MAGWVVPTAASQVSVGDEPVSSATDRELGLVSGASVYVPDEFKNNQAAAVPGLGTNPFEIAPPNSRALEMGITPEMPIPGTSLSVSMTQGLQSLLTHQTPKEVKALQGLLVAAGYLNPKASSLTPGSVATGDATYEAYANVLNDAVVTGTPYLQLLQTAAKQNGATPGSTGTAATAGTPITPRSETTSHVELTSAPDAAAIAKNQFESLLGRNVTTKESQAFYGALTAYEQANPATTTDSVGGTSTNENVSETSSGGIGSGGAEELADNDILQHHGAEYAQAQGNQIYNLFSSLIGGG